MRPLVAETAVGAPGVVDGIPTGETAEAEPVPDAFVAVTVNVYETPFVRPVTPQYPALVVQVKPPGDEVTVYEVIGEPPFEAGAVQPTET